jgi:hypothetical protein
MKIGHVIAGEAIQGDVTKEQRIRMDYSVKRGIEEGELDSILLRIFTMQHICPANMLLHP